MKVARNHLGARRTAQKERQRKHRKRMKDERRPDRDDVARVVLFWLIKRAFEKGQIKELDEFQDQIVAMLAEQGFNEQACYDTFEELIQKYKSGRSPFRRKVHLFHPANMN